MCATPSSTCALEDIDGWCIQCSLYQKTDKHWSALNVSLGIMKVENKLKSGGTGSRMRPVQASKFSLPNFVK